ncbi:MAG TPA: response regulator, partial [Verrucomicrobiales bacterium]|nr:response regulator [Verrucomicrobiales bacterium]
MDKKRILIIDDEPSFTRMVRLNLEKTGRFEVREENAATRALSVAREFKPDLVLLDVLMPSLDGGDVAAQLRRNSALKEVPIIFLTATVSARETEKQGLSSGGGLFLGKPISSDHLIQVIDQTLPPAPADAS